MNPTLFILAAGMGSRYGGLKQLENKTPFDDRPNREASIDDISPLLVREYLVAIGSNLLENIEQTPLKEIYHSMDLLSGPEESLYPKNIALMMFNHRPEKFFPYSRIEIVEFPKGLGDPTFYEKPAITGPVYTQIRQALLQLQSVVLKERIHKLPDRAEADRVWNYPFRALEESVVNALYHKLENKGTGRNTDFAGSHRDNKSRRSRPKRKI
jgi:ATP-dependent DNA helicase RecG